MLAAFTKEHTPLATTPIAPPVVRLRSPFTGELWPVPPDALPEFVAELEKRGFVREDEPKTKEPR